MGRFLLGHLRRCKRSVEWRDVSDVYLTKRPTQVIHETVGAGASKSVCFLDLLGWTVVSHERLRSHCTQFVCLKGIKSSALRRIASAMESAGMFGWLAYEKSHRRCTPQVPITGLPSKEIDGRTAQGFLRDLWRPSLAERS